MRLAAKRRCVCMCVCENFQAIETVQFCPGSLWSWYFKSNKSQKWCSFYCYDDYCWQEWHKHKGQHIITLLNKLPRSFFGDLKTFSSKFYMTGSPLGTLQLPLLFYGVSAETHLDFTEENEIIVIFPKSRTNDFCKQFVYEDDHVRLGGGEWCWRGTWHCWLVTPELWWRWGQQQAGLSVGC